jgi:hypothetical protein
MLVRTLSSQSLVPGASLSSVRIDMFVIFRIFTHLFFRRANIYYNKFMGEMIVCESGSDKETEEVPEEV